jgi:hypothetical protein
VTGDVQVRLSAPGAKRGRLQRAALEVLREHEARGELPTSGRFVFYELEQRGVIPKVYRNTDGTRRARTPAQDIADALYHLRETGTVPWAWIVDETRALDAWAYAPTVGAYVAAEVRGARIDCWAGQAPPLILTESRSLAGVLRSLAAEYLCPIAATNGQVGGFLHTDIGPALKPGQLVLYLGDLDPAGEQIEANTRAVLDRYAPLAWGRLALTPAQVDAYSITPIDKTDHRFRPARPYQAYETEALQQGVIVQLVRDHLDALLPEPLADVQVREREQRAALAAALARMSRP